MFSFFSMFYLCLLTLVLNVWCVIFPSNYIIIIYLFFRLAQPYSWEKDIHILYTQSHWLRGCLIVHYNLFNPYFPLYNSSYVVFPGRLCDTCVRGYLSLVLLRMTLLFKDFFPCTCLFKIVLLTLWKHSVHEALWPGTMSYLHGPWAQQSKFWHLMKWIYFTGYKLCVCLTQLV